MSTLLHLYKYLATFNSHILDIEVRKHCQRTSDLSEILAFRMGLKPESVEKAKCLGLLHDIGKIRISPQVLNKRGQLTPEEWEEIYKHPPYSAEILLENGYRKEESDIVRWHHEKLDGSGYPDGLTGDKIPIESQIITVADIYDALTNRRRYRKVVYTPNAALNIITRDKGLNNEIVQVLKEFVLKKSEKVGIG